MRMLDTLSNERMDFLRIRGAIWIVLFQLLLQALDHEGDACELLAEIVMQIDPNALAFLLGDVQQLLFEALSFFHLMTQLGVGFRKSRGSLDDTHFEFIARLDQLLVTRAQFLFYLSQLRVGPEQLFSRGFKALVGLPAFAPRFGFTQFPLDRWH